MYWPPGGAELDEAVRCGQTKPLSPSCGSCEEDGCPACRGGTASARSPSPRRRFGKSPSVSPPPARSRSRKNAVEVVEAEGQNIRKENLRKENLRKKREQSVRRQELED